MTEVRRVNNVISDSENIRLRKERIARRRRLRKKKLKIRLTLIALIITGISVYGVKRMIFNNKDITEKVAIVELSSHTEKLKKPSNEKVVTDNSGEALDDSKKSSLSNEDDENVKNNKIETDEKVNEEVESTASTSYMEEENVEESLETNSKTLIQNSESISVLVNKKRALSSEYAPEDLIVPNVPFIFQGYAERKKIRESAANALEKLFNAAQSEGYELIAVSGYRSYDYQKQLFDNEVAQCGSMEAANEAVAMPGESEHQTGLAMDITGASVSGNVLGNFEGTPEAQWVYEHCHEYGFIVRYPEGKTDITGYMYEPWHIRYVGEQIAAGVKETGLTYDEYYEAYLEN